MNEESRLKEIVNDYFVAFEAREMEKCLEFFDDDAVLHFATGRFPGIKAIEQWHKDRFKGGMRITEVKKVEVQDGNIVNVDAVATSPKLKLVRIDNFRGTGKFVFKNDKFIELRMGLRTGYRFHI